MGLMSQVQILKEAVCISLPVGKTGLFSLGKLTDLKEENTIKSKPSEML